MVRWGGPLAPRHPAIAAPIGSRARQCAEFAGLAGHWPHVTALVSLNKPERTEHAGNAPPALLDEVGRGLRRALDL